MSFSPTLLSYTKIGSSYCLGLFQIEKSLVRDSSVACKMKKRGGRAEKASQKWIKKWKKKKKKKRERQSGAKSGEGRGAGKERKGKKQKYSTVPKRET